MDNETAWHGLSEMKGDQQSRPLRQARPFDF
jgi:hypothetical protein